MQVLVAERGVQLSQGVWTVAVRFLGDRPVLGALQPWWFQLPATSRGRKAQTPTLPGSAPRLSSRSPGGFFDRGVVPFASRLEGTPPLIVRGGLRNPGSRTHFPPKRRLCGPKESGFISQLEGPQTLEVEHLPFSRLYLGVQNAVFVKIPWCVSRQRCFSFSF